MLRAKVNECLISFHVYKQDLAGWLLNIIQINSNKHFLVDNKSIKQYKHGIMNNFYKRNLGEMLFSFRDILIFTLNGATVT